MDFITKASDLIRTIGNGAYHIALVNRCELLDLIDETRNKNGQCPDMILDQYFFLNEADIAVRVYFDHIEITDHPKVTLRLFDLIKHMHFNGETTLHNQEINQVDKLATKETITRGHIVDWMNDIISGRVGYKKVEIVLI